jgi:hypothetical protein
VPVIIVIIIRSGILSGIKLTDTSMVSEFSYTFSFDVLGFFWETCESLYCYPV